MPRTETIAKKDFYPLFKKGDKVTVVPILYEEDTLLVNEIHGLFDEKTGKLFKIFEKSDLKKPLKGLILKKMFDAVYAPKGYYKDSYIELSDGRTYPSSCIRRYEDYLTKIKL